MVLLLIGLSNAFMPKIHYTRFLVDGEVADLLVVLRTSWRANKSAASRCISVFGKQHDTIDTTDFCPRQLVTDLLRGQNGETDVMDFGLYHFAVWSWATNFRLSFQLPDPFCVFFVLFACVLFYCLFVCTSCAILMINKIVYIVFFSNRRACRGCRSIRPTSNKYYKYCLFVCTSCDK